MAWTCRSLVARQRWCGSAQVRIHRRYCKRVKGTMRSYCQVRWYDMIWQLFIYIYGTPARPTFQANLVVFTVFFLTFWTLKLRAFFGDQKLQIFASLFPSHPSLSTLDPRFKIPKTSWIRRPSALNLESKEVGLKKFFLSLESWILRPDT